MSHRYSLVGLALVAVMGAATVARANPRYALVDDQLSLDGKLLAQTYVPPPPPPGSPDQAPPPGYQQQQPPPGYQQQPPPGYQQQPGYPPPGYYAPPPAYYAPPPRQVHHYEYQPRWGLFAGGVSMFAAAWTPVLIAGIAIPDGKLVIPVIGPWIFGARLVDQECAFSSSDTNCALARLATVGLVFDGLIQAGGVAMLIAGVASRKKVAVYAKNGVEVSVLPQGAARGTGAGLVAVGHF